MREFCGAGCDIGVAATRDTVRVVGAIATPCGIGAFSGATACTKRNGADVGTTAKAFSKACLPSRSRFSWGRPRAARWQWLTNSHRSIFSHDEEGKGDRTIIVNEPERGCLGTPRVRRSSARPLAHCPARRAFRVVNQNRACATSSASKVVIGYRLSMLNRAYHACCDEAAPVSCCICRGLGSGWCCNGASFCRWSETKRTRPSPCVGKNGGVRGRREGRPSVELLSGTPFEKNLHAGSW